MLVTNASTVPWHVVGLDKERNALRIGCRWIDAESNKQLSGYDDRFDIPYDLPPGDTATVPAVLKTPAAPGNYTMQCDAVQELVHWFHDLGSPEGIAPVVVLDAGPPLRGSVDRADRDLIAGWAWEKARPNNPASVEIYDGDKLLATLPADVLRDDLKAAHIGNGAHSFAYPNPFGASALGMHTTHVRIAGKQFELPGSPKILTLAP